jgi:hypothetical protein
MSGLQGPRFKMLELLTFGLFGHNLAKQYIIQGKLNGWGTIQQRIQWTVEPPLG